MADYLGLSYSHDGCAPARFGGSTFQVRPWAFEGAPLVTYLADLGVAMHLLLARSKASGRGSTLRLTERLPDGCLANSTAETLLQITSFVRQSITVRASSGSLLDKTMKREIVAARHTQFRIDVSQMRLHRSLTYAELGCDLPGC